MATSTIQATPVVIETNAYASSTAVPADYGAPITIGMTQRDTSFPSTYGMLFTFALSHTRGMQFYTGIDGALYFRTYLGTAAGWSSWGKLQTTT